MHYSFRGEIRKIVLKSFPYEHSRGHYFLCPEQALVADMSTRFYLNFITQFANNLNLPTSEEDAVTPNLHSISTTSLTLSVCAITDLDIVKNFCFQRTEISVALASANPRPTKSSLRCAGVEFALMDP